MNDRELRAHALECAVSRLSGDTEANEFVVVATARVFYGFLRGDHEGEPDVEGLGAEHMRDGHGDG